MKSRSLKFEFKTLTYNGPKVWNQFYFDLILNEFNFAKSKPKRSVSYG